MAIKYISDLHWFDVYSEDWRGHLGLSLEEFVSMNVREWNTSCTDDDIIIIDGDLGRDCHQTIEALNSLRGNKVLVLGNHDKEWSQVHLHQCFKHIVPCERVGNIFVCHYPDFKVPAGCYLVHGHHHGYDSEGMQKARIDYLKDRYRFNCCTDLNNYRPSTFFQLQCNKEGLAGGVQSQAGGFD